MHSSNPRDKLLNLYLSSACVCVCAGGFDDLGMAEGSIDASVGPVRILKLRVHAESDNWAILSEVSYTGGWIARHLPEIVMRITCVAVSVTFYLVIVISRQCPASNVITSAVLR